MLCRRMKEKIVFRYSLSTAIRREIEGNRFMRNAAECIGVARRRVQYTFPYIQCHSLLEWSGNCSAYIWRSYRRAIHMFMIICEFTGTALRLLSISVTLSHVAVSTRDAHLPIYVARISALTLQFCDESRRNAKRSHHSRRQVAGFSWRVRRFRLPDLPAIALDCSALLASSGYLYRSENCK